MSCPSSIRRQDSNPQPLERESPLITTRPGLPLDLSTLLPPIRPCDNYHHEEEGGKKVSKNLLEPVLNGKFSHPFKKL